MKSHGKAWLLDLTKASGASFMELLTTFANRSAEGDLKRPRIAIDEALTLVFYARVSDRLMVMSVPPESELIWHPGNTFVVTDGSRSLRLHLRSGDILLSGQSGFRRHFGNPNHRLNRVAILGRL